MNVTLQNISVFRNVERPNTYKIGKQLIVKREYKSGANRN